ncbi:holin [Bacillus phage vB_BpsS-140]|nr:holin [Bacillus phage vB_BpsS-140]
MFDKEGIIRFVWLVSALLTYFGVNMPESVTEAIVAIALGIIAIWTAWKDNDITKEAIVRKKKLKELEEEE